MFRRGVAWLTIDYDSRGNRLIDFQAVRKPDGSESYIDMKCCDEIAHQVVLALTGRDPELRQGKGPWTHRCAYSGPYTTTIKDALELLQENLTLCVNSSPELDGLLALDFYKIPDSEVESKDWENTEVGGLVNAGKYWRKGAARRELAAQITSAIQAHPYFAAVDSVVSIPGTKHNFGELLADTVAQNLGVPLVPAQRDTQPEHAAKEGFERARVEEMSVELSLSGQRVLVVDDVYRSGISMRSAASAARRAGAQSVLGIACARTLRN
jgi:adenine/guanine phosphoribosyltransferase-like PRPP-binding protein